MDRTNKEARAALAQQAAPEAVAAVIKSMKADPDYAWSWHCNVAMSFVDAGGDHYTANQGAARFMKLLAGVEPAHELPAAPQAEQQAESPQEPLTDEQIDTTTAHLYENGKPVSAAYRVLIARAIERTLATRWGVKLKESN